MAGRHDIGHGSATMADAATRAWRRDGRSKSAAVARTASHFHIHAVKILKTHTSSNNDNVYIRSNGN